MLKPVFGHKLLNRIWPIGFGDTIGVTCFETRGKQLKLKK